MDRMERRRLRAVLYDILLAAGVPVPLTELVAAVQEASPLAVKDPRGAVRRALANGVRAIPVDGGQWVLMQSVLEGAAFRCTPHAAEIQHGRLYLASRFSPFLPVYPAPAKAIRLIDAAAGLEANVAIDDSPGFGLYLAGWYRSCGFVAGDSIIVSVSYADALTFGFSHEPLSRRDPATTSRTRAFADAALNLLMRWGREEAPLAALVQGVLARHEDMLHAPPDDYRELFARDGRFRLLEGGVVSQLDYRRPIDYLYLFPKWGRGSFEALNPGYCTPLESGDDGQQEAAGHWLRLVSAEVTALDLAARKATLRVHTDSSAGAFRSDVEVSLRARAPLARTLLATLRNRFKLLVAGQAPVGRGRGAVSAVVVEDEVLAVRRLTGFLRSLAEAAETPSGASALESPGWARLEFSGPLPT
jgi:hypothetical protein